MDEQPAEPTEPLKKNFSLDDLIPAKVEVVTSLGPLFVRNANSSDWKHFESKDSVELGKIAVQKLTSRVQGKRNLSVLSDADVEALLDTDILALAPVIAKKSEWGPLPVNAGLTELGDAVKSGRDREIQRHQKRLDEIRSIESSYGFLGKSALDKLQEQMSGLANIRESISSSVSLQAAIATAGIESSLGAKRASETLGPPIQDYFLNMRAAQTPPIPYFMPPEKTVLGKATLESAENSRETSLRMSALVEIVGGLNQTIVVDILPGWIKKAESDQKQAESAFIQAGNSLKWTKWAVIVSVVVSLLSTLVQIYVTEAIDQENSETQKTTISLLREQLVEQQNQSRQQALEANQLRQLIEKQSINAGKLHELLELKLPAPGQQQRFCAKLICD